MQDPVVTSLEQLAALDRDVSREIYDRFAARHPEWAALMSHMDAHMVGRMMQDVLVLLMTVPEEIDGGYLSFEMKSHQAYGVTPEMFPPLLEAARDTVREHLGSQWSAHAAQAWEQRIAEVCQQIEGAFGSPVGSTP